MNNNYYKLNQVMLKLFNSKLLLETFNPVFCFNLHIYKSLTVIYELLIFFFNKNQNFTSMYFYF